MTKVIGRIRHQHSHAAASVVDDCVGDGGLRAREPRPHLRAARQSAHVGEDADPVASAIISTCPVNVDIANGKRCIAGHELVGRVRNSNEAIVRVGTRQVAQQRDCLN